MATDSGDRTGGATAVAGPSLPWGFRGALFLVGLAFWWFQALTGYAPTDDGFVLSQSWRLLQGQLPHVDFTSPRPVGSAFVHLPELLLPAGNLAFSRLVVVMELLWIAAATVAVGSRRMGLPPVARFALVLLAFFGNVGAWPIMAWHTFDGICFSITALWLATKANEGSRLEWGLAWLLAGAAPLMKQGFGVALPLIALVAVLRRSRTAWRYAALALLPGAAYWMLTAGAPGGLLSQLYTGSAAELTGPVRVLWVSAYSLPGRWALLAAAVSCSLALAPVPGRQVRFVLAAAALLAPVLWFGGQTGFGLARSWSDLAVLELVVVAALLARDRDRVVAAVGMVALAYATSLSWGVPDAGATSGSCLAVSLLLLLASCIRSQPAEIGGFLPQFALASFALFLAVSVWQARSGNEYEQPPASSLTAHARAPSFALIRMTPSTAAYLDIVSRCVSAHPAGEVAILPASPGVYPLLRLHNPFDTDWWTANEEPRDFQARVDVTVAKLNATKGWLVLELPFDPEVVPGSPVGLVNQPVSYRYQSVDPAAAVLARLAGQNVSCGALMGKYRPG